jgi:hypothetical protein
VNNPERVRPCDSRATHRLDSALRIAILSLPAVQAEIAQRALFLRAVASLPAPTVDHWRAAEEEALLWIDTALACISAVPPVTGLTVS